MTKIVLCGSMVFINTMREYADLLMKNGFSPVIPDEDDWDSINENEKNEYKRKVSRLHFDQIASGDTNAILVVNDKKNGLANYIGANSFAEIAIAFYFNKKIFILNDIYQPYKDELLAWGVHALNGNIHELLNML